MVTARELRARKAANAAIYRRRLKAGHIRVLDLHPSPDPGSPIECDLILVDLRAASTAFKAVSYCWGNEALRKCITINTKQFWVRPNLAQLLIDLRHEHDNRSLWIDAICINQEDLLERNMQVGLMWNVYSTAITVIIWLGEETSNLVSARPGQQEPVCYTASDAAEQLSLLSKPDAQLPEDKKHFVESVKWLLSHSHFGRLWVVAECALAKYVEVQCGSYHFPLRTLSTLLEPGRPVASADNDLFRKFRGCLASQFCSLHDAAKTEPRSEKLLDLLKAFRHNECSDPKDKIFALISICRLAREHITIDYRNPAETVLVEVLEFLTQFEDLLVDESMEYGQMLMDMLHLRSSTNPLRLSSSMLSGKIDYRLSRYFRTQLIQVATVTHAAPSLYEHAAHLQDTMSGQRLRTFSPTCLRNETQQVIRATGTAQHQQHFAPSQPHTYVEDMSPQDLHPFNWQLRHELAPTPDPNLCFGLATVDIKPGHLICVFSGWQTALVVESSRWDEFNIIGRAVIRIHPQAYDAAESALSSNVPIRWSDCCTAAQETGETRERIMVTSRGACTMSLLQLGVPLERNEDLSPRP